MILSDILKIKLLFIQGLGIFETLDIDQGEGVDFLDPIYFSYGG